MLNQRIIGAFAMLILLLGFYTDSHAQATYRVVELRSGSFVLRPTDMNNDGTVVGYTLTQTPGAGTHIATWSQSRGMQLLAVVPNGGGQLPRINSRGEVAWAYDGAVYHHYDGTTSVVPLPAGFVPAAVLGIADDGRILVSARSTTFEPSALVHRDGTRRITTAEGRPTSMNGHGDLCSGTTIYRNEGGFERLGFNCERLNERRDVSGFRLRADNSRAAVRRIDGREQAIEPVPAGWNFSAHDMNNQGHVVGRVSQFLAGRAALFTTELVDLNSQIPSDSGWVLTDAIAINESGIIAAAGTPGGGAILVPSGLPPSGVPAAPGSLTATVNGSTARLQWTGPPNVSYLLSVGSLPGTSNVFEQNVGSVTSVSGQAPVGTYYARVRSVGPGGTSPPSTEVSFSIGAPTPGPGMPPSAPSDLLYTVAGRTVTLTWTGALQGTPPVDYIVEAGSASGLADFFNGPVGTQTSLSAVVAPGTYFVRIRSRNAIGVSGPSNEVVISIP